MIQPLLLSPTIDTDVAVAVGSVGLSVASTIAVTLWRALQTERANVKELINGSRSLEEAIRAGAEASTLRATVYELKIERLQATVDEIARRKA